MSKCRYSEDGKHKFTDIIIAPLSGEERTERKCGLCGLPEKDYVAVGREIRPVNNGFVADVTELMKQAERLFKIGVSVRVVEGLLNTVAQPLYRLEPTIDFSASEDE